MMRKTPMMIKAAKKQSFAVLVLLPTIRKVADEKD
jgi:hypothetical protein